MAGFAHSLAMTYKLPADLTAAETSIFWTAALTPIPPEWENPHLGIAPGSAPAVAFLGADGASATDPGPIMLSPELTAAFPPVVGLQGKPHAGKDTVAWIAALGLAAAGRRAVVIGTSDPVIAEANQFLGPVDRTVGHGNKSWGPYRLLLQTLGQVRRRQDPRYWNKPHMENILRIQRQEVELGNGFPVIFITGLRTPSDLELIQESEPLGLACPAVRVYRAANPYADKADHPIERQLDHIPDSGFQYVIRNDAGFDTLRSNVQCMCVALASLESARLQALSDTTCNAIRSRAANLELHNP